MEVSRQQEEWLKEALQEWQEQGLLDRETAARLRGNIHPEVSSAQQLGKLFVLIASACAVLALAAVFIDDKVLERFRRYYDLSQWAIAVAGIALGTVWYVWRQRASKKEGRALPAKIFPGTILLLTGMLYVSKAIYPLHEYNLFFGAGALLCAVLALRFRSLANWIAALALLAAWYATFSETHSVADRFLGLNYPARFAVLGLLLTLLCLLLRKIPRFEAFQRSTLHAGLLLLLSGLWGVSVFGNFTSLDEWTNVRQITVIQYGLVSALASIGCIWYGVSKNDDAVRDYGVVFLLLNFYTRYFEFFWGALNKAIFFVILAALFYATGKLLRHHRKAEPPGQDGVQPH